MSTGHEKGIIDYTVDNLPNKPSDDWTKFSGVYPDPANTTNTTGTDKEPQPAAPAQTSSVPPPPEMTQLSQSPPLMSTVTDTTPVMTEVNPGMPPLPETPPQPSPPTDGDMPLPDASSPSPKSSGILKRVLIIGILLIILFVVGFAGFKVIGMLTQQKQPITLTYWGLWEDDQVLLQIIEEYKKTHPNVNIVYSKQTPKQYRVRLQNAINKSEGPDLFRFHNTWVPMLSKELQPAGKTGYSPDEFKQTFYPVTYSDLVSSGKVYGVPLMIDGLGLYYNEDLLRAAGVTPPTTWEEFREAALALTVKDEDGKIITAGTALGTANNVEHFSDVIALMMLQNKADLKNPTSDVAADALSFYRLFAEPGNNVWDDTLDNSILAFASGKVAMIFAPSWQVFTIRQLNPDPEFKFQIIPVPQLAGDTVTWASYWVEGVSSKSKHPDEAWEFLKYLSGKETMVNFYTEVTKLDGRPFGEPYSRVDLAPVIINDPYVGAYIRQAQTAQSFFLSSRTYDEGINDRMIQYVTDAVNSTAQGASANAALETMAKGFSQVLSDFDYTTPTP